MPKQYDVPLVVTTPYMRGQKVKDAQYLLAGHNVFEGLATYKDGKIDGQYGPLTAQATKRAKFYLGYPEASCDGTFGQTLYEYLVGKAKLSTVYASRRRNRLSVESPGLKALALAEAEIGYKENPPGSNNTKFGIEYGFNRVPWCAIFESIMFKHSGTPKFRYASVYFIYADASANRNGLHIVRTPKPGDVIGYKFNGDRFAHTAFFVKSLPGGKLQDLGGNTGPSDFSNGGMVLKQERSTSLVSFYARVS